MAAETVIDEIAEKLNIDPLELRRINGAQEGTAQPAGPKFKRIGYLETIEAIKNSAHYQSPLPRAENGKLCGRGVASGFWFNAAFQSSATVSINTAGTANVVTGSPDIGGSRVSCAMIAAEVLGLTPEEIGDATGLTSVQVTRRVKDLSETKVIYDSGLTRKHRNGRSATVWRLVGH